MAYRPTVGSNIEAEFFKSHRGTRMEPTTDVGGGFNSSYLDATDYMTYQVTIPQAGNYTLQYRVASPNGGVVILGKNGVDLVSTAIPVTGGWQNWQTVTTSVFLQAGTQEFTVWVQTGGWNLNWWKLTPQ
jgi:hypothetical protein